MVNIAAVPDRFENAICKTESQDVLDRLFAQIVIDTVNLFFVQDLLDLLVQGPGRIQVPPEWLFDDHSPPVLGILCQQT